MCTVALSHDTTMPLDHQWEHHDCTRRGDAESPKPGPEGHYAPSEAMAAGSESGEMHMHGPALGHGEAGGFDATLLSLGTMALPALDLVAFQFTPGLFDGLPVDPFQLTQFLESSST
jgi:hypothetical protein